MVLPTFYGQAAVDFATVSRSVCQLPNRHIGRPWVSRNVAGARSEGVLENISSKHSLLGGTSSRSLLGLSLISERLCVPLRKCALVDGAMELPSIHLVRTRALLASRIPGFAEGGWGKARRLNVRCLAGEDEGVVGMAALENVRLRPALYRMHADRLVFLRTCAGARLVTTLHCLLHALCGMRCHPGRFWPGRLPFCHSHHPAPPGVLAIC